MKLLEQFRSALFAVLVLVAGPALAGSPPPLDAYGDLPGIEDVGISPSGTGLAIIGRIGSERRLIVLDGEHKLRKSVSAGDAKIRDMQWVGEEAVLLITSVTEKLGPVFLADKAEIRGALVVPIDGNDPWMVFQKSQTLAPSIYGDYGLRYIDGKWQGFFKGIEFARSAAGLSIFGSTEVLMAVDLKENSTRRIDRISSDNRERRWLIDGAGRTAATIDYSLNTGSWEIANAQGTRLASGVDPTLDIRLCCFGQGGASVIYQMENDSEGTILLYEVPLTGGTPAEFLADKDIERLFIDSTNGSLLGYLESGSPPRPNLFDPEKQNAVRKVYRAFPKLNIELRGWTPNFSHLLIRTSGNGDSGSWYLVDIAKLKADPIGTERPLITSDQVGPISTISYRATDGLELDGILTLPPGREPKNLPVIVLPHGGPHAHDEASFDWWAQAFASRGYAVFQPNFRGSTNRDDSFMRAGYGQWGRKMQSDISDGLAELVRQGIADPKRACIVGASYGGYAALAGVTLQQGLYRCAVAVAPVSDLKDFYATRVNNSGSRGTIWRGLRESLGHPDSFDEVSPRRHAVRSDAPILLIHGKDDTVVPFDQSSAMAAALRTAGKPYELVVLRGEDHWLSRAATRKQMLEEAMRFVQQHNPAD